MIIGSPDEVEVPAQNGGKRRSTSATDAAVAIGSMGKNLANYNSRLFAEKVMPQLTDVFADWQDRRWPQPIDRAARAPPDAVPAGGDGGGVRSPVTPLFLFLRERAEPRADGP